MAKRKRGAAAFYRTFTPERVKTLEEAIIVTREKAAESGFVDLEVIERRTGVDDRGYYFVALEGRVVKRDG